MFCTGTTANSKVAGSNLSNCERHSLKLKLCQNGELPIWQTSDLKVCQNLLGWKVFKVYT
jgi:hypothetical protein